MGMRTLNWRPLQRQMVFLIYLLVLLLVRQVLLLPSEVNRMKFQIRNRKRFSFQLMDQNMLKMNTIGNIENYTNFFQ